MIKLIFVLLASTISFSVNAFPELPFCPMGGPPGWMHRFLDRHDHDRPPVFYQPQGYYPRSRAYPPQIFRYGQPSVVPGRDYDGNYGQRRQPVMPSLR